MNKHVNFKDNVFILLIRIRMIQDAITLDADPEMFLEKVLDDIDFIDQTLRILLDYLRENDRLISRDGFLKYLSEAESRFERFLGDFLRHEGNISIREIPTISEKLLALQNGSMERQNTIDSMGNNKNPETDNPVVTKDELAELLKAF